MTKSLQRMIVARSLVNIGTATSGRYEKGSGAANQAKIPKAWKQNVATMWNDQINAYCTEDTHQDPVIMTKRITDVVKNYVSGSTVSVRVPIDILDNILQDGRLKNQFETGTSHGTLSNKNRAEFENNVFGIPIEGTAPQDRPIYGYLNNPTVKQELDVAFYGSVELVLNDDVRDRTTFTMDDSLSISRSGQYSSIEPSPVNAPDVKSFAIDSGSGGSDPDARLKHGGFDRYVEAQIHGGVSLKDIKAVKINFGEGWGEEGTKENAAQMIEKLKVAGITGITVIS